MPSSRNSNKSNHKKSSRIVRSSKPSEVVDGRENDSESVQGRKKPRVGNSSPMVINESEKEVEDTGDSDKQIEGHSADESESHEKSEQGDDHEDRDRQEPDSDDGSKVEEERSQEHHSKKKESAQRKSRRDRSESSHRQQKFGSNSPNKRFRTNSNTQSNDMSDTSSSSSDEEENGDGKDDSESSMDSDDDLFSCQRDVRDSDRDPDTDNDYETRNLKRRFQRVSAQDKRVEDRSIENTLTVVTDLTPKMLTKLDHHHVFEWVDHVHALRSSDNYARSRLSATTTRSSSAS
jgi:hypothetical protein